MGKGNRQVSVFAAWAEKIFRGIGLSVLCLFAATTLAHAQSNENSSIKGSPAAWLAQIAQIDKLETKGIDRKHVINEATWLRIDDLNSDGEPDRYSLRLSDVKAVEKMNSRLKKSFGEPDSAAGIEQIWHFDGIADAISFKQVSPELAILTVNLGSE